MSSKELVRKGQQKFCYVQSLLFPISDLIQLFLSSIAFVMALMFVRLLQMLCVRAVSQDLRGRGLVTAEDLLKDMKIPAKAAAAICEKGFDKDDPFQFLLSSLVKMFKCSEEDFEAVFAYGNDLHVNAASTSRILWYFNQQQRDNSTTDVKINGRHKASTLHLNNTGDRSFLIPAFGLKHFTSSFLCDSPQQHPIHFCRCYAES